MNFHDNSIIHEQMLICNQVGAEFTPPNYDAIVGVSINVTEGAKLVNGLRHPSEGQTCGWYIWGGQELLADENFFKPFHLYHILELRPEIAKFFALPPGWRFLKKGSYEDLWYDSSLWNI